MDRRTIGILFGGCSEEHDVSVKSAMEIAASVDTRRYDPLYIGITRSGTWKLCETPCPEWEDGNCCRAVISPDQRTHGLLVLDADERRVVHIDAVFPVLHGKLGEGGAIQGLLELSGIPYVGCDIQSSAICMDKSLAYIVARHAGIDTPDFVVLDGTNAADLRPFAYPVFVKPARSGSSFGVSKVECADELDAAIRAAQQYDQKVLIEQAIRGTEVGCAVLGTDGELIVGEVDQIKLTHGIFRIHQEAEPEKGSQNAVITVPAHLPPETREKIQETAKSIYRAMGCRGLSRVDMFLLEDGGVVLNEVNTLPGFTAYSRYPRMMAAAGISLSEVFDHCISLAMGR